MSDCQYPGCSKKATDTFALVPLCEQHRVDIRHETAKFYGRKGEKDESIYRPIYMNITHLIPWSKARLEAKRKKVRK